ncbi:MAG: glycosyltransferase [Hyphomicrobiaceae bacterium]|nr:glycosyltransferase [Hyphomicrobiaceae bacterium]
MTALTWVPETNDFYPLAPSVARKRVAIGAAYRAAWFDIAGNARRLSRMRSALLETEPDAAISYLDGTNELFLLATLGCRFRKYVYCQNDIAQRPHYDSRWAALRRMTYPLAHGVVFLDSEQAQRANVAYPSWNCIGIPNPVPDLDFEPGESERALIETLVERRRWLVAMGRLVPQKGFDMLFAAFAKLAPSFPDWNLLILGEGKLRQTLQKQLEVAGLADRVRMPGLVRNPHAVMRRCDLFVLSSRYEGQALALAEALSCGLPAVSFDCPSGPRLIVRDGVDGLLAEANNVEALAEALATLMRDDVRRASMAKEAPDARERFGADRIAAVWDDLLGGAP